MRQIYSAGTYFQLLTAIQVKTKLFPDAEADIVFSDHSRGYESIVEKLKALQIFGRVYTAQIMQAQSVDTFPKRMERVARIMLNDNSFVRRFSDLKDLDYDEFVFFNMHYYNMCLFYQLKAHNPALVCRRYEEGYTSGFSPDIFMTNSAKLQEKTRKLHRSPSIMDIDTMYFYEPELVLFHNDWRIEQIPKFDKNDAGCRQIVNGLFGDVDVKEYDRKYIFFEESYFREGLPMDDLELVLKIADVVGKDELMVKLHPRTPEDRFAQYGIKTNKTVGVPWEAVIMNCDFSENVFLSIASGSILTPRLLFGENVPTYMLYNCTSFRSPWVTDEFHRYMERFTKKFGGSGFWMPNNEEELFSLLKNGVSE